MFTSEELLKSLARRLVRINVGKLLIMVGLIIGNQKTNRIRDLLQFQGQIIEIASLQIQGSIRWLLLHGLGD
jgi:hypothetical protein